MTVTRTIEAPVEAVVPDCVRHQSSLSKALPRIVKVDFLSTIKSGVGMRFRETHLMKGKEATTELAVAEYAENDRIRFVANSHGTVWETAFSVQPQDGSTALTVTMDANFRKLLEKLVNPLIDGMIKKAVEQEMDMVKAWCESQA